jgi:hypothetical protein
MATTSIAELPPAKSPPRSENGGEATSLCIYFRQGRATTSTQAHFEAKTTEGTRNRNNTNPGSSIGTGQSLNSTSRMSFRLATPLISGAIDCELDEKAKEKEPNSDQNLNSTIRTCALLLVNNP